MNGVLVEQEEDDSSGRLRFHAIVRSEESHFTVVTAAKRLVAPEESHEMGPTESKFAVMVPDAVKGCGQDHVMYVLPPHRWRDFWPAPPLAEIVPEM
jgi:hypothetical protein